MKNRYLISLLLLAVLGAIFFAARSSKISAMNNEQISPHNSNTEIPKELAKTPEKNTLNDPLPPAAQEEIKKCLGTTSPDLMAFYQLVKERAGSSIDENVQWRSIFFEQENKRFRLSLVQEISETKKSSIAAKLFMLDKDDLPDVIPLPEKMRKNPSEKEIQEYLREKRITKTEEAKTITVRDGQIYLETENDQPIEVRLQTEKIRISCGIKFQASCKCFTPKP